MICVAVAAPGMAFGHADAQPSRGDSQSQEPQARAYALTKPSECLLQDGGESAVLAILPPQTLRLADGRVVRLAEIAAPQKLTFGVAFDSAAAVADHLKKIALGQKVAIKFGGAQRDRYGIYSGQVFVTGQGESVWLQENLVAAGLALAQPKHDNHACANRLLAAEDRARREKRGYWGLSLFKVLKASEARPILNLVQTYQIVEGKVASASEGGGGKIVLRFGGDERDFTAIIGPSVKKAFTNKKGVQSWVGAVLRLRGWIERRRGPLISLSHQSQIEVLATDEADGNDAPEKTRP